jgi:hypothetical protein
MSQMIEEILEMSSPGRTLLDDYMASEERMRLLHDGAALRRAVEAILAQLPVGHVTLLATSPEGIGLAAATAARRHEPTDWQPLHAVVGLQGEIRGSVVIVEPVDPGCGWRSMITRVVRDAVFAFATADVDLLAA